MPKKNTDHIIVDYAKSPPVFRCTICDDTEVLVLPVSVTRLAKLSRAFILKHEDCSGERQLGQ
jgi:hypothetical protein